MTMARLLNSGLRATPHRARRYSKDVHPDIPEDLTTVADLTEWVGDDRARAEVVLVQEQAKPQDDQRSTLLEALNAVLLAPPDGGTPEAVVVPEGDLDSRVQWVADGETGEVRHERADAVFAHEKAADPDFDEEALSSTLHRAVYQDPDDEPEAPAPAEQPAPAERPVSVPEGMTKVGDLTKWAGTDAAKAQAVLDMEQAKPAKDQRKTLVASMQGLVEQHDLI
jgi:hypothetical protein